MTKPAPQMLTASRLIDGTVLWRREGNWVDCFADGEVYREASAAEAALADAQTDIAANKVVGAYLFEVREDGDRIIPAKEREIIRAAGPSVRADLGKQAADRAKAQQNV